MDYYCRNTIGIALLLWTFNFGVVQPTPAILQHRYTFNRIPSVLSDSVTRSTVYDLKYEGVVGFNNSTAFFSSADAGYILLPSNLHTQETGGVSFELWVNTNLGFGYSKTIGTPVLFRTIDADPASKCPFAGSVSLRRDFQDGLVLSYTNPADCITHSTVAPDYAFSFGNMQLVVTLAQQGHAMLYVNGVVQSVLSEQVIAISQNSLGTLGGDSQGTFSGSIEDVRIWDGIMSAEDVLASYLAGPDMVFDPGDGLIPNNNKAKHSLSPRMTRLIWILLLGAVLLCLLCFLVWIRDKLCFKIDSGDLNSSVPVSEVEIHMIVVSDVEQQLGEHFPVAEANLSDRPWNRPRQPHTTGRELPSLSISGGDWVYAVASTDTADSAGGSHNDMATTDAHSDNAREELIEEEQEQLVSIAIQVGIPDAS